MIEITMNNWEWGATVAGCYIAGYLSCKFFSIEKKRRRNEAR